MTSTLSAPLDARLMNLTASALFMGFGALVLAAFVWWLVHLPVFAIRRIVVQGELVHNSAVTLRANIVPMLQGNFFTINLDAARAAFEQAPWVRRAQVHREYPGTLRVQLQEHQAAATWGPEGSPALVNTHGEVFEASVGDADDELPRLAGPKDQAAQVLAMYQRLAPVLEPLGAELAELEQTGRGGWRAVLDSGARLELGAGEPQAVVQRAQRFVRTLDVVAAQYQRNAASLESADLRHPEGYALRLRGVSTLNPDAPPPQAAARPAPKPGAKPQAKPSAQAAAQPARR